ncbi:unnamed protein product [Calicophoron daubneyi]|uniref:Uncharacterized protein n=1 Tax=Calicophoron daubneyi TaxID=300641 RepID=A0AAV2TX49_CALDB
MEYVLTGAVPQETSAIRICPSSVLFWTALSENPRSSTCVTSVITALLLSIANEAAIHQLRTVYIRPAPLHKPDFVHIHGTSRLDTSNWDNIHFIYIPDEASLVRWFSRVHLSKRFADVIVVEGLDIMVSPVHDLWTSVLRLTSLMEETRRFIHNTTRPDDHGHDCRLIVSCRLPPNADARNIPTHSLAEAYVLGQTENSEHFELSPYTQPWKLTLEMKFSELFWTDFLPVRPDFVDSALPSSVS